ncbi:hypothetical protein SESBI_21123 [Sesbania bispinosa]|nr:hypothetical protein SESBI_21123 [Sesbania bispinosa]
MACAFNVVKNVHPGRQTWRLKGENSGINSEAHDKKKFKELLAEEEVYKMYYFGVVQNLGFIGVLTAVAVEKRGSFDRSLNSKAARMLGDVVRCRFNGTKGHFSIVCFASGLNNEDTRSEVPVVVVQYAKVKRFRGVVVLQNVLNTTRILWNLDIFEVVEFKHWVWIWEPLGTIEDHNVSASPVEEFLHVYSRKTISELYDTEEDRFSLCWQLYIVIVLTNNNWWYSACKCNRAVTVDGDNYYCANCASNVSDVTPRWRIWMTLRSNTTTPLEVKRVCVVSETIEHYKEIKRISTPKAVS